MTISAIRCPIETQSVQINCFYDSRSTDLAHRVLCIALSAASPELGNASQSEALSDSPNGSLSGPFKGSTLML